MGGSSIKALLTYGFNDMRLEDVPEPAVEPGCLKVRVEVCQPSVTDVLRFRGIPTGWLPEVRKTLESQAPFQLSGHEFCGEVVDVGEGVEGFRVGDRVSSRGDIPCGRCRRCREGDMDSCENKRRIGITYPGCFAEYVVIPALGLEKISYDISGSEAACLQPLSSAVACVETANIVLGDVVVVMGQGVMGLYCSQIAAVSGASVVVGVDVRDQMLDLARELKVDVVVHGTEEDPISIVRELT
ncbi:MAG: alcohol dehydrogenase catalytic domain-containing protein, partial [Bacillota bacterium]